MAYRPILWQGIRYESYSEIAVGEVLESYIDGWKVAPGISFQVLFGGQFKVDFVVGQLLIEYHPFRTPWRVKSEGLPRAQRLSKIKSMANQAARSYENKRRTQIDHACPGRELVVVGSGRELLEDVIRRCSQCRLPALSRFEHDFDNRIKELAGCREVRASVVA
jgi:hypothetical protein